MLLTPRVDALSYCPYDRAGPAEGFAGVETEGVVRAMRYYGYDDAVVIGSALMHYSFNKAADMLGLGVDAVIRIPTDNTSRMRYCCASNIVRWAVGWHANPLLALGRLA